MWIGELARRASLNPRTIRYYENIDLLARPPRTPGGFRDYGEDGLERLAFIRSAQSAGLRLGEIRATIAFRDHGVPPCRHVLDRIGQLTDALPGMIDELGRFREELRRLAQRIPPANHNTAKRRP